MKPLFQLIKDGFESLLFPSGYTCVVCDREAMLSEDGICDECRSGIHPCGVLPAPQPLDALFAEYHYDPVLRNAMHGFKYGGATWRARFFMRYVVLPVDWNIDAVVPVPMHPLKEYYRRYNPPEVLALALKERFPSLPVRTDLLKKIKLTRSQTTLTAAQRHQNVQDVFRAAPEVKGMSVLLIDDVTTTHSTLVACAKALKAQGAKRVYALCACSATHGEEALPNEE